MDDYDAQGYDAGFEFHHSPNYTDVLPRPPGSWPVDEQKKFRAWEKNYETAVQNGTLPIIDVLGSKKSVLSAFKKEIT